MARLVNAALLIVLAFDVTLGARSATPPVVDACGRQELWSELTAVRTAIVDAEQTLNRAVTSLEQAAAREQLERLEGQLDALVERAERCDDHRVTFRCGTR